MSNQICETQLEDAMAFGQPLLLENVMEVRAARVVIVVVVVRVVGAKVRAKG